MPISIDPICSCVMPAPGGLSNYGWEKTWQMSIKWIHFLWACMQSHMKCQKINSRISATHQRLKLPQLASFTYWFNLFSSLSAWLLSVLGRSITFQLLTISWHGTSAHVPIQVKAVTRAFFSPKDTRMVRPAENISKRLAVDYSLCFGGSLRFRENVN